jgi:hypothetical protein
VSLPDQTEIIEIASLSDRLGSARLAYAARAVGKEKALVAAAEAGAYLLADELCQKLRLEGLEIPGNGELSALSPNRWRPGLTGLPEGTEVCGLILSPEQEKRLTAFAGGGHSPGELFRLAEHFFFEQPLKVAIRYTAPRFKPS